MKGKTDDSFSRLCTAISRALNREGRAHEDLASYYASDECGHVIDHASRARLERILYGAGFSANTFYEELVRRIGEKNAHFSGLDIRDRFDGGSK